MKQYDKRLEGLFDQIHQGFSIPHETLGLIIGASLVGLPVLIEDVPGTGKTTLAKTIARTLGMAFSRIQGAPDLLPSDLTGITTWNQGLGTFTFKPGPLFANLVLVDELNRTGTRTQAALLEALEEGHITVDGVTHPLPQPYFLMATQNPFGFGGTYSLPEAQLDRFGIQVSLGWAKDEELVLQRALNAQDSKPPEESLEVTGSDTLLEQRLACGKTYCPPLLCTWVKRVLHESRSKPQVHLGLSTRAGIHWLKMAQATAYMQGRSSILPSDLVETSQAVLNHRIVLNPQSRAAALDPGQIVKELLGSIPLPNGIR